LPPSSVTPRPRPTASTGASTPSSDKGPGGVGDASGPAGRAGVEHECVAAVQAERGRRGSGGSRRCRPGIHECDSLHCPHPRSNVTTSSAVCLALTRSFFAPQEAGCGPTLPHLVGPHRVRSLRYTGPLGTARRIEEGG
jgi:hypothetical protein